ncbi:hypothetical protein PROPHIGD54-2_65 [Mycobacterium phage prophiGD54-2]|uniref:hypothetical protein n=1 Tax=Mycobacteroides abscessus TaxID=36809 RepID=UPI0019CF7DA7|nr:hypothetical protein [Mycobacteroides abscessus]QSM04665.1 hypothetical protein PROPHIGD54-2_65 [Mycobacterium phage prophiGD54-2]QSN19636.1 hypothetical protein I3U41_17155 [Mycobacteroides abscessus subsp. abscessus]
MTVANSNDLWHYNISKTAYLASPMRFSSEPDYEGVLGDSIEAGPCDRPIRLDQHLYNIVTLSRTELAMTPEEFAPTLRSQLSAMDQLAQEFAKEHPEGRIAFRAPKVPKFLYDYRTLDDLGRPLKTATGIWVRWILDQDEYRQPRSLMDVYAGAEV